MTGPPYPHPSPAPGTTGIGQFQIGVSPIGDVPTFDPWVTLLSQYANSPVITAMILEFNAAMDMTQNCSNFYDMMWNIQTAQGYGLDVWGRIVNTTRILTIPGSAQFLGFGEAGGSWTGFGQGIWASPGAGLTQNYLLGDTDFRRLILAKAATNITDGSIQSTNAILLALFPGRGNAWVADGLNMQLTYTFAFALTPAEFAIVQTPGILPAATGVIVNIAQV
jgi:hypothetical protein